MLSAKTDPTKLDEVRSRLQGVATSFIEVLVTSLLNLAVIDPVISYLALARYKRSNEVLAWDKVRLAGKNKRE